MKQAMVATLLVAVLVVIPISTFAHEHQVFEIGGTKYEITIGSLNEPVTVDDKTGVDLRVSMVGHEAMEANEHHGAGGAVTGLEETLQVELIAGDKRKTLPLSPVYNTPGAYKAPFYPTVATTLTYRVFGEIAGTPVDLSFTCSQAGHAVAEEDTSRVTISGDVVRTHKSGSFGCPVPKAEMGFPENSKELASLGADATPTVGWVALALSILALGAGFVRRR